MLVLSRLGALLMITDRCLVAAQRIGAQLHQTALTANAGTEALAARMPP
jgi:hypothetical protein